MPLDKILWEMGIKILDVAIIAFFGFKFLSKPIAQAMADRSAAVRAALEEATAGRREAEARLAEFQAKAAGLDKEIETMRSQAAADMERERTILINEGKAAAEHVAQHARETIRQEVREGPRRAAPRSRAARRAGGDRQREGPDHRRGPAAHHRRVRRLAGERPMITRTVSRRYAKSLMAVAVERGASPEEILADLENAAVFLAEQPRILELFKNPKLPMADRLGALERFLAASHLQPLNQNFLRLLLRKQRIDILGGIVEEFRALADAQAGIIRAAVTSAAPLTDAVVELIRSRLATRFGKQVILSLAVDPELIGGLVVRVGSLSFDGSIRSQLKAMQSQLLEGVPLS